MGHGKPVVVVGSINLDLVASANHLPAAGETVLGSDFQMHPGGKGANQAVAAARLGYPVQMIGRLGSDSFGDQLQRALHSAGVDQKGVTRTEGSSGVAVIVVGPHGENSIIVTPGANAELTPEYLDQHREQIRDAGIVLTQLEIPLETVQHLALLCATFDVPLMLDPAPAATLPHELLARVAWFTPNETEAAFYVQDKGEGAATLARDVLALGPRRVLLKMGQRGAYIADRDGGRQLDAIQVTAVDTTAAGDAFNGAFAVGLMRGMEPIAAARFAMAAAAVSVTRHGAQPSMPTLPEVQQLLAQVGGESHP